MKKCLLSLLTAALLSLTSCGLGPTPKLYTNFEHASLKTRNASKEEWDRTEVNEDFSYICDFVHPVNGRADNFIRVFYRDNQVFEEKNNQSYMPYGTFVIADTLYYAYGMFDDEQLTTVTTYCLKIDKIGQSSRFSLPGDNSCKGVCTDGEYCYFLIRERQNNVTKLIKTNLDGEVIYAESTSNDYYRLLSDGTNLYTTSSVYSSDLSKTIETKVYKWEENHDDNLQVGVYSIPGSVERLSVGDKINAISYLKNGDTYSFYKTEETESNIVCQFTVPDDLGYSYQGVEQFNNDLVIGFTAHKKATKSLYCRVVFLYYESSTNKILSYCPNQYLYNIIYKNSNVFFGTYSNKATNDTSDGDFRTFVFS